MSHRVPLAERPEDIALRQTITFDNGTEFARHFDLNALGSSTYFCDPHASRQKGGFENALGRRRRFLPRKIDLAQLDKPAFATLIAAYNNKSQKCPDWKTPPRPFLTTCCTSNENSPPGQ